MKLLVLLLVILACLIPSPVLAADHAHIVVTAQGFVIYPQAPTNLVSTTYGTSCFNMTWTKGLNAPTTVMVACRDTTHDCSDKDFGNLSDGCWVLYNGSGTSFDHNSCGLDLDLFEYHITAWGTDGIGNYSVHCANLTVGGGEMIDAMYWGMGLSVAGLFTIIAFWRKLTWVFYVAGIGWIILGIFSMSLNATATMGWAFGWLYLAVGLVCISAGVWFREKKDPIEDGRDIRYRERQTLIDAKKKSW